MIVFLSLNCHFKWRNKDIFRGPKIFIKFFIFILYLFCLFTFFLFIHFFVYLFIYIYIVFVFSASFMDRL